MKMGEVSLEDELRRGCAGSTGFFYSGLALRPALLSPVGSFFSFYFSNYFIF